MANSFASGITVGVIGCGYVGFSLINSFKNAYKVIGYDISKSRILNLNNTYKIDNVEFTTEEQKLNECNVYLIAVPTNITQNGNINLEHIKSVKNTLYKYIKPNDTIVIESSIYIGCTRELFSDFLNHDVNVGFSPERISPGDHDNCKIIPKIVSGLNLKSLKQIKRIYSNVVKKIIPVTSTETAELCKLYENCFRVVNIAYVNEIADLSKKFNIDFDEVMEASATKPFGFMSFRPGFGIGGFCLPQNPYYLMYNLENSEETMPVLTKSIDILNKRPVEKANEFMKYKNILVMGMGFKEGQEITAFSPTLVIYEQLKQNNKKVTLYDTDKDKDKYNLEYIKQYDCIVIGYIPKDFSKSVLFDYQIEEYGKIFKF
jgi:nucleotide sugar dehydrogenase